MDVLQAHGVHIALIVVLLVALIVMSRQNKNK